MDGNQAAGMAAHWQPSPALHEFIVTITETTQRMVVTAAADQAAAKHIISEKWLHGEYARAGGAVTGVKIDAEPAGPGIGIAREPGWIERFGADTRQPPGSGSRNGGKKPSILGKLAEHKARAGGGRRLAPGRYKEGGHMI